MKKAVFVLLFIAFVFPLLGSQALAAKDYSAHVTQVEIKAGDTLYAICKAKGMDYDKVRDAILIVNGFSNEQRLNAIRPGQKLLIPNSADAAVKILSLSNATTTVVILEDNVVKITVKKGDTIFSICTAQKLNYRLSKEAIKNLNNMTSDEQLNRIYAGQTLYLPVNDTVAGTISKAVTKATDSNINVSTATEDKFEYYLVSYTMAPGDTARSVSTALGTAYSNDTAEIIKGINGLSDLSRMQAGHSYLFPSASSAGTAYAVYSHLIVSGDSVANLCSVYGVNYSKVSSLLQGLNPKTNFSAIQPGRKILLIAENTGKGTPLQVQSVSSAGKGLLPVVTKNPTNETVVKGGSCFFAARYQDAVWAVWHFVSPDGKTDLTYQDASKQFPTMKIINGMYSTMKLENIPAEANGWKVYCRYTNNLGSTDSASALLTVKSAP